MQNINSQRLNLDCKKSSVVCIRTCIKILSVDKIGDDTHCDWLAIESRPISARIRAEKVTITRKRDAHARALITPRTIRRAVSVTRNTSTEVFMKRFDDSRYAVRK